MSERRKRQPEGSKSSEFGADEKTRRLSLLTLEQLLEAINKLRLGKTFCSSLPLTLPIGSPPKTIDSV